MNVHHTINGSKQANLLHAAPAKDLGTEGPSHAGHIDLSTNGEAVLNNPLPAEVHAARKALLGIPPLSKERAAHILKRIQEGYYSEPEVVKQMAVRLTKQLGSAGPQDSNDLL